MERLRPEDPEVVGPWSIVGRLGSGGMGEVFIGEQGTELVAIKVLHRWLATDLAFRNRFEREIESISRLDSPNIAKYISSDLTTEVAWLAIEYVDGPSLKKEIEVNGPLNDERWNSLARGLLSALKEMQFHNVVHRDIKPGNIILSQHGPKLVDFGLSQQVDSTSLTTTGMIAGSPAWISPEAINGESLNIESDLFSVGSVLAFAKEGRNIWGDGLTAVVFNNIVTRKYKLTKSNQAQRQLIEGLFSKDLRNRIKSMDSFLNQTQIDLPKNISSSDPDKTEVIRRTPTPKFENTLIAPPKLKKQNKLSSDFFKKDFLNARKSFPLLGIAALLVVGMYQFLSSGNNPKEELSSANPTISISPTPKISIAQSPEIKTSPTPKLTKSATPTKSATTKPTVAPAPTSTTRWWTDDMVLWNDKIAYRLMHWDGGCNQYGTCFGSYGLEVLLQEPCSSMSAEVLDDSGKSYVMYRTAYSPTGQKLSFNGAQDETHETAGKLTKLICNP